MYQADIYLITNLINNKQYVGQTIKGYLKRWRQHCYNAKFSKNPQLVDKIIRKYGVENFKIELLETTTFDKKDEREIYYINYYNTYKSGYNITLGGDINPMSNDKVRKHHKEIMSSLKTRLKISEGVKKTYTSERCIIISNQTKQRWINGTPDFRKKILSGFMHYNLSKSQKVAMLDKNDNIIMKFSSCSEACRYLQKPTKEAGHIKLVCNKYNKNGTRTKHFGYSWIKL